MKTSTLIGIVVLCAVLSVGIYVYSQKDVATPEAPTAVAVAPQPDAVATVPSVETPVGPMLSSNNDPLLGNYMVAKNDMTLYLYTKDGAGKTNCRDACATTWPPYTINPTEVLNIGDGVRGKVGTTTRADGSIQLTYNGMPLHFYSGDAVVGDKKGQNFEGVWFMVKP